MSTAPVIPIVFGGLIAWSVYRRVRRNIGRQKLHPRRAVTSIVIFSVLSALIAVSSARHPDMLLGFGAGLVPGILLGFVGLRLTRFETTDEGHFYTPSAHIGVALSVLFVGRLLYRMMVMPNFSTASAQTSAPVQSPLTLLIFGLVAGYYLTYMTGVLIHSHDKRSAQTVSSDDPKTL